MKCLQKYWNNSIDEYSCWCENFVIFYILGSYFSFLIHIFFLLFQSGAYHWEKLEEEFYRMHQVFTSSHCIKSSCQVYLSRLHIKFFYQVFVSSLGIYQVFVSSLRIKSSYIAFVFSLCIKSWYQVFISSLPIKSSISSLRIKSSCQVFVSSLRIKSSYQIFISSFFYQVFVSSFCIKSLYQVFLSSLRIKSKWLLE